MIDEPFESNRSGNEQKFSDEHLINSGWSHAERDTLLSQLPPVIFQFAFRVTNGLAAAVGMVAPGVSSRIYQVLALPLGLGGRASAEMGQVTATRLVQGRQRSGSPLLRWDGMDRQAGCGEGSGESVTPSAHTDGHTWGPIQRLRHTQGHRETWRQTHRNI